MIISLLCGFNCNTFRGNRDAFYFMRKYQFEDKLGFIFGWAHIYKLFKSDVNVCPYVDMEDFLKGSSNF